jgi:transcription antitermination factor NusG
VKKWWVVTYSSKQRELILDTISDEGFDMKIYCPMVKVSSSRKGIVKIKDKALFYNYMFCLYDRDKITDRVIRELLPMRHLRIGGNPRFISGKEIQKIKRLVKSLDGNFDKMRDDVRYLRKMIGRMIIVRDGALTGLIGKIVDARHKGKLVVELLVFSRPIKCEVAVEYVEFTTG